MLSLLSFIPLFHSHQLHLIVADILVFCVLCFVLASVWGWLWMMCGMVWHGVGGTGTRRERWPLLAAARGKTDATRTISPQVGNTPSPPLSALGTFVRCRIGSREHPSSRLSPCIYLSSSSTSTSTSLLLCPSLFFSNPCSNPRAMLQQIPQHFSNHGLCDMREMPRVGEATDLGPGHSHQSTAHP